jgi:small subunit ribosomal protein S9
MPTKKTTTKKKTVKKKEIVKYIETVGRRKTAVARVRIWPKGKGEFIVNEMDYKKYFPIIRLQRRASASLEETNSLDQFKIQVLVKGGGDSAQAEAVRHGIARALVKINDDFKKRLKKAGYLTRDPRMRERKKFGLKRARRAPQFSKR